MARSARSTCRLTVEQLTAERPQRASVGAAMRYLAHCTPEERAEAMARVDAAFAAIQAAPVAFIGPGIPKARTSLYLKKNMVPVVFAILQDRRAEYGTLRATTDGSIRRAFWFNAERMIIEEQDGNLVLAGIPRRTRTWINEKNKAARLGYAARADLEGEATDEQRATWKRFCEIADATEQFIDKARKIPTRRSTLTGINPW